MGVCVGLNIDQELPEAQKVFTTDGKCLANFLTELSDVCESLEVTPFSAFVDGSMYDVDEEDLADLPEEVRAEIPVGRSEPVEPRPCKELLSSVSAVLGVLQSDTEVASIDPDDRATLVEELRILESALVIGSKSNANCTLDLW